MIHRLALVAAVLAMVAGSTGCTTSTLSCDPPNTTCSTTVCANLDSDPQHCGGCNHACGAGQTCVKGACSCPPGTLRCVENGTTAFLCVAASSNLRQSLVNYACESPVFAACFNTGELVSLNDNLVPQSASTQIGSGPQSIGFADGRLLVADRTDNALYRLGTQSESSKEAGGDRLDKAANQLIVQGNAVYIISSGDNVVQVIDLTKTAPTQIDGSRTDFEIATTPPGATNAKNTAPWLGAFAGGKLYVTLRGNCSEPADTSGNRLLEVDVTKPGRVTRELVFQAADYTKDAAATANSSRPSGVAAVGTKLFVAIGNLTPDCTAPAGPGYLAVVDTAADPLASHATKLPDECRNPGFVLASADRVYVTCVGANGVSTPQAALVVLDPATEKVLKTTTFKQCDKAAETTGPNACKPPVPGRMTLHRDRLIIADTNAGRLLVTDLDGNVAAGFENGVDICPLQCPGGKTTEVCYQSTSDVFSLP